MTIPVHASVHINVADSQPEFCGMYKHRPGDGWLEIANSGQTTVYISGSRSEIVDWARRVTAAAHEMPRPK